MRSSPFLLASLALLLSSGSAQAKPAYPRAMEQYFGPLLPGKLTSCNTCHAVPGSPEPVLNPTLPKPHNAFGARLMAVVGELKQHGGRTELPERLDRIGREDSDGDGVSNYVELLTGHSPGSKVDRPTEAETRKAPQLLTSLQQRRSAYPWQPFAAVKAPAVPKLGPKPGTLTVRNPVDAFLAAEHRKQGLTPRLEAPREVLLRRVYVDLTGLPPTAAERRAYLADQSPDAYEKLVDRLLASPLYGQRWGRHWMDVWRYSDWDGYGDEVRNSQPHIWRWRDWIVDSLNTDKPYDRMVQEMLAGDELAPEDPAVLPATGFLVRNWHKFSRTETLNRLIEGTSKAFLGVTINCARCHDHKYDPISMAEYYKFRAIFEPYDIRTDRVSGQLDTGKDGIPRAYDANAGAETFLLLQGDDRKPDKAHPMLPGVPTALAGPAFKVETVSLPLKGYIPDKQEYVIRAQQEAAEQKVATARKALEAATEPQRPAAQLRLTAAETGAALLTTLLTVEKLEDQGAKEASHPQHAAWKTAAERATALQRRLALDEAEVVFRQAMDRVQALAEKPAELAKAREALTAAEKKVGEARLSLQGPPSAVYSPRYSATFPATSTGRRLALARWITDKKNPLTARVAVNHLWLRHFGKPLVPTVFDFGGNGQVPTHPALLDWLSSEFMRQGWSMKRLHRLLLTSSAYRMDSGYNATAAAKDPDNRYLWRMNSRRMEAEIVRDSLLHVSGQLNLTAGGPELDQNQGLTVPRRSLYFRHSVEKQVEFLATFDQANVNECYERIESVVPQQALALANSSLALGASRVLAKKLWNEVRVERPAEAQWEFVANAWEQILGRMATPTEQAECLEFLRTQTALLSEKDKLSLFDTGPASPVPPATDPAQRARENLIHVLFNHNEFVTVR